jgi:uncharacterized protein (DUF885 family)
MDAFFASYYRRRPVNATFIGVHDFDDSLPDLSESGAGDALADIDDLLRRSGEPRESLSPVEALDRRLARGFLRTQSWEFRSEHFHRGNPSLYTGEAVFAILGLFLTDFAPLAHRIEAATARMHVIPSFLAQARANVRRAPRAWTERAIRECDGAVALFTDGAAELGATRAVDTEDFLSAADRAAQAFSDHRVHLASELVGADTDRYACGPEAFDTYLRDGHFLEQSADEIVRYAEDQIAQAEAHLAQHAADFGASDPTEALSRLNDFCPEPADYYASYQHIWDDVRHISDQMDLLTWPDFPIRYVPRPTWTRKAAPHLYFLFYRSPAAFQRPEVHDYLVAPLPEGESTEFLRSNNNSVIKLNHVIHHGGLGHHVQNWHAFRAESRIGQVAAVDCASRIAMFCGGTMAEGWACYATDLASEAGALTPLEQYAEVHGRVRMAARAVVDVRLHHGEISLEEAAAYYRERAGMSHAAAHGEAVKNTMFPAAAVMYLMGTDAIHQLKRDMMRLEGPNFEQRRFHDTFLSYGSIPVSLIEGEMKRSADDAE